MSFGRPQFFPGSTAAPAVWFQRAGERMSPWFVPVAIASLQAVLAWIGYLEATADFGISPVWPAAGFGVAMAIIHGNRVLPALWVGMTAVDLAYYGNSLPVALWMGLAVAAGAGFGAWLVRRFVPRLGNPDADWSDAALFLFLAAVGGTALTAAAGTLGLVALDALPASALLATALTWWTGDGVGVLTVAPFLLAWSMPDRRAAARARPVEFGVLVLLTVAASAGGFWLPAAGNSLFQGVPGVVLVLPFLVWLALRFGVAGAATATLVVAIAVTSAAVSGVGTFGGGTVIDVYRLQFLLGIVAATTLLLGATASRKDFLQEEARRDAAFVRSIADNLPGAVFRRELDARGRVTYPYMAGRFAEEFELTGLSMGHELDREATGGLSHLDERDLARLHDALRESARTMEPFETELRFVASDGDIRWVRSISSPHHGDRDTVIWDGLLLEVTEEKRQRAQAEYLARHDPLTGLMNRAGLHEVLGQALSRAARQGHSMAICIVDLDGFKDINDTHGHKAGDLVLGAVAERLRNTMRLEDIKARMGGDEFVVVQTDVQGSAAVEAACERLAECLPGVVWHEGEALYPRASIGVALYPQDGEGLDAVFAAADEAMYSAKSRGDGAPVFYNPAIGQEGRARSRLTAELADAIERRELEVHYQPQVHVATGRVSSVEALVRWCHPEHGWISPARFVPLAEETGLVSGLDHLVLETVLADMHEWDERGTLEGTVAVNLSGASLRCPEHRAAIGRLIEASGLPPGRLELELTETTLIHAADERISDGLRALAALGVHFSADDFGTGYGSLTYLRTLPITRIKIDRSFVQGAPTRVEDAEIIRALLQLAGNLGLQVVAEGVETAEELEQLRQMGCHYVQGFYFARPMARAQLESYLAEHGLTEPTVSYSGHLF